MCRWRCLQDTQLKSVDAGFHRRSREPPARISQDGEDLGAALPHIHLDVRRSARGKGTRGGGEKRGADERAKQECHSG